MSVSAAFKRALLAQETDEAAIPLLTIAHPDMAETIRVACDGKAVTSRGNDFVAYPFAIDLPDQDPDRPPSMTLTVDNVDQDIVAGVRAVASPPTVTLEIVDSETPDTVEVGPYVMQLNSAAYDPLKVSGQLGFDDVLNEEFPGDGYTPQNFPDLF